MADLSLLTVKQSLADGMRIFSTAGGGRFIGCDNGVALAVSGHEYPSPLHNAALRTTPDIAAEDFMLLIDSVFKRERRPYVLWLEPGRDDDIYKAATDLGLSLTKDPYSIGMIARAPLTTSVLLPNNVLIERVTEATAQEFSFTVCDAFGFDDEQRSSVGTVLASSKLLNVPGVTAYILRLRGKAVSTAMTIYTGGEAGLYYVGTKKEYRRDGLGTLLVRWATAAAFGDGVTSVCLEADVAVASFYEGLNFSGVVNFHTLAPRM